MPIKTRILHACLFGASLSLGLGAAAPVAFAAQDELPGDDIAPPVNINIALLYNYVASDGSIAAAHGSAYSEHTHISTDITVARYIRTMEVGGIEGGFQGYVPYVAFLGQEEAGTPNIPAPLAGFPAFGPGKARLSASSGFGAPNISAFAFPINNAVTGTYWVIAPWLTLPTGNDNKTAYLNPSNQNWVFDLESGIHKELIGTPSVPNLAIDVWGDWYSYSSNNNSAYTTQTVYADHVPGIYDLFGVTNPLQTSTSTPASFHEQSTEEFRVYLPYEFAPAVGAFIVPGFYQSFGGKQTYTLHDIAHVNATTAYAKGTVLDSGNRTNETQLRLYVTSFFNPSTNVTLGGYYDVAAHGGPLDREFVIRFAHFF